MNMFDVLFAMRMNNTPSPTPTSITVSDILFIDYDGTILYSYNKEQFLALTAMPPNPTHDGLTSQGWNWSLTDAKLYVTNYGKLIIGQTYITNDGKTRAIIQLEEGRLSPRIGLGLNGTAIIDWGDKTEPSIITSTMTSAVVYSTHNYTNAGEYTITISINGEAQILSSSSESSFLTKNGSSFNDKVYANSLISFFCGDNLLIGNNAFSGCTSLKKITIPNNITSIGTSAFYFCYSLLSVTIPNEVSIIKNSVFYSCISLLNIAIPNTITAIQDNAFTGCYKLKKITIPNGVISIGGYAFSGCNSLLEIIIPNTVTTIYENAFQYCYALTDIILPNSITSIGNYLFSDCYALSNVTIPNTITTIKNYMFQNCKSLIDIEIPNSITSIGSYAFSGCCNLLHVIIPNTVESIGGYAFQNCYSLSTIKLSNIITSIGYGTFANCYDLTNIIIPDTVTSIAGYAFNYCYGLGIIKFTSTTPPTVSNTNAWTNIPNDCKILVPQGTLETYKTAQKYPNPSTYSYEEYLE